MKLRFLLIGLCVFGLSVSAYVVGKSRGFDEAEAKNLPYHLGLYVYSYEVLTREENASSPHLNELRHDIIMTVYGIRNRYQSKPELLDLVANDGERKQLVEWINKANTYLKKEGY